MITVYILKTYKQGEDKFGVECVFNTLRVGFPTSEVIVEDNVNHIRHDEWISRILLENVTNTNPIVFLDGDVIFYDNVEPYLCGIKELLAGRYTPNYYNEVAQANEVARFHTSLLFIKNPKALSIYIRELSFEYIYFYKPITPFVYINNCRKFFYDTCADLYHMLPLSERHNFESRMLDKYTHLCCGSMLNFITSKMKYGKDLKTSHELAKVDPENVKGLWRLHDLYYKNHPSIV